MFLQFRKNLYLSLGILSIRTCLEELFRTHERSLLRSQSGPYVFFSELMWREFYRHIWVFFPQLASGEPFREDGNQIPWRNSPADLRAWQEGRTGIPIIDAAMRCFNQTGFMHNRLRMIVASFLTKNLLLDWRLGEEYFLHNLIDADVFSNNGGWQWSASVGVDPQPYFRVFNPITQSERYDEQGSFIRQFVPELKLVDKKLIHTPKLTALEIKKLGYCPPLCDLNFSRKRALESYAQAFRK
ncbi:MAG: Deoxyribodipyrimidine photo-lyase [bacterium ADurb.BinA186]|nr:MAG: Deoxyribodipyrimidine photo-lyase [bacterium ADurb.BinA186]